MPPSASPRSSAPTKSPPNTAPETARGFESINDLAAWRRHGDASDLIRTVDNTLQGMNAAGIGVDMFLAALPRWYAGIHFATTPWAARPNGNSPNPACKEGDINLLEALGLTLATMKPLDLDEGMVRGLSDAVAQARELIAAEPALPDDIRVYLLGLIIRAEMVIKNYEQHGPEAARQVSLELGGALFSRADIAEHQGDPERATRLRACAHMLVGGFVGSFGERPGRALQAGAAQVFKQITEG